MPAEKTISALRFEIEDVFAHLDRWCARSPEELAVVPEDVGWSIALIIEHIGIVNHYLLLTLRKGVETAVRRAARGLPIPADESDLAIFGEIADPDAFDWQPPKHMLPKGKIQLTKARSVLDLQRYECLGLLDKMAQGEGFLHTIRMSVRDLGRLDMYQWLWFLLMHARRHLTQMERTVVGLKQESTNS
ncbi:MAG TPA: DinB family protein [Geobacteraceae bacterium]|nr:DinB family protein [Geobacteraceae bacterium]